MIRRWFHLPGFMFRRRMNQGGHPANVCMAAFSHYPADPRVRRAAEALAEDGMHVEVICLRDRGESATEIINGVVARRIPLERRRGGRLRYAFEYGCFFTATFLLLSALCLRRSYRLIHIHNMPDFLVFTAILPRLLGSRIILDLHDPMPEVFQAKFGAGRRDGVIHMLLKMEKLCIAFVHLVLTPNDMFEECFIRRSCPRDKILVVMNSPDERIFTDELAQWAPQRTNEGPVVMFHGGIYERHGLRTALHAIHRIREQLPGLRFEVYGDGDDVTPFLTLVGDLHLSDIVRYHGRVTQELIAGAIPSADIGLIPNEKSPFTMINMPTRIFEYLALNRPLIAPRTPGILDYFSEDMLFFFEPGDANDLARAILEAAASPAMRQRMLEKARPIYLAHCWRQEKRIFVSAVHRLLEDQC